MKLIPCEEYLVIYNPSKISEMATGKPYACPQNPRTPHNYSLAPILLIDKISMHFLACSQDSKAVVPHSARLAISKPYACLQDSLTTAAAHFTQS